LCSAWDSKATITDWKEYSKLIKELFEIISDPREYRGPKYVYLSEDIIASFGQSFGRQNLFIVDPRQLAVCQFFQDHPWPFYVPAGYSRVTRAGPEPNLWPHIYYSSVCSDAARENNVHYLAYGQLHRSRFEITSAILRHGLRVNEIEFWPSDFKEVLPEFEIEAIEDNDEYNGFDEPDFKTRVLQTLIKWYGDVVYRAIQSSGDFPYPFQS